ncbi:MAG TPA: c-type cytochrome, partial [Anaeromyxobacteraceae bacterium]
GKALRVPPGASDVARLGADVLGTSCMGCHRVRGAGGTRGPELTAALAREPTAFATALRDHLRRASGQSAAPETTPAAAGQVLAFLRAIELAARPEDEAKEPEQRPEAPPAVPGRGPRGY